MQWTQLNLTYSIDIWLANLFLYSIIKYTFFHKIEVSGFKESFLYSIIKYTFLNIIEVSGF